MEKITQVNMENCARRYNTRSQAKNDRSTLQANNVSSCEL